MLKFRTISDKISGFNFKYFLYLFSCVLFLSWLGIGAYFYEDSIYLHYATSFVSDLDFNIINQVDFSFIKIITSNFSHPAHHSFIQTPIIVILNFFDRILFSLFGSGATKPFEIGGTFLSFLGLVWGHIFSRNALKQLGFDLTYSLMGLYVLSTSLLYFSFFTLTTIEIFLFALSSFALNEVLKVFYGNDFVDSFLLGFVLGMLLTAKFTFIWLVLGGCIILFEQYWRRDRRILVKFILGILMMFLLAYLKDYVSFGKFVLINQNMASFISEINILDIYYTLRLGVFGVGGLFYVNPLYGVSLLGLVLIYFRRAFLGKRDFILWSTLLLWILSSYFQCLFIIGPLLDDHYTGRTMLTALPVMLLGLCFFDNFFKEKKLRLLKVVAFVAFITWQFYTLSNYLTISHQGHYAYAMEKTVKNFPDALDHVFWMMNWKTDILKKDFFLYLVFSILASLLIYSIYFSSKSYVNYFKYFFIYTLLFLIFSSILNLFYSKTNGFLFLEKNKLWDSVAITSEDFVYSFSYVTDSLRSQYYNSTDPRLKKMIIEKHSNYLREVKKFIDHGPPELKRALKDGDVNYSFYQ